MTTIAGFFLKFLYNFPDIVKLKPHILITSRPVRFGACLTVLYPLLSVGKVTATLIPQTVQGAVTEQAVKLLFTYTAMAGKIFTVPVLKKGMIKLFH